ncbi:MAG: hypothetical protein MN733_28900 [Nitrososphaera sp.]|nr:hypothetical protein [Nitrososphaera sp.]
MPEFYSSWISVGELRTTQDANSDYISALPITVFIPEGTDTQGMRHEIPLQIIAETNPHGEVEIISPITISSIPDSMYLYAFIGLVVTVLFALSVKGKGRRRSFKRRFR